MSSHSSSRAGRRRRRRSSATKRASARRARALIVVSGIGVAALLVAAPSIAAGIGQAVADAVNDARYVDSRNARVLRLANRHGIDPDLARDIEAAAVAEGIDPDLAFRLVAVESAFDERAVSPAGALGLTQLMPTTARWLQPGITREQIFDRRTNLRLGFRYLRSLLRLYDGRVDEALHAYNRGPGTVQRIRAAGGDPANGYADRVLRPRGVREYIGTGLAPMFPRSVGD